MFLSKYNDMKCRRYAPSVDVWSRREWLLW